MTEQEESVNASKSKKSRYAVKLYEGIGTYYWSAEVSLEDI